MVMALLDIAVTLIGLATFAGIALFVFDAEIQLAIREHRKPFPGLHSGYLIACGAVSGFVTAVRRINGLIEPSKLNTRVRFPLPAPTPPTMT